MHLEKAVKKSLARLVPVVSAETLDFRPLSECERRNFKSEYKDHPAEAEPAPAPPEAEAIERWGPSACHG